MKNWPEYAMEAAGLALFMMSAGLFGTLLEDPGSAAHQALASPLLRRSLMGLAMGLTAVALIYSPWGKRSGAHLNPATTLTFFRLGKVAPRDACGYVVAHFLGGLFGIYLVGGLLECRFL
jgi:aquaporin Z